MSSAKSLTSLSLHSCKIEPFIINGVKFRSLHKLSLEFLMIDEHTVKCLISSCHSIEELLFQQCWGLKKLQISGLHRLKTLEVRLKESELETIDIPASSLHVFQLANLLDSKCHVSKWMLVRI